MIVEYMVLYLLVLNMIAVIVCIIDKVKARRQNWRVSEKTLFLISILGGAVGMYMTMKIVHHKTLHKRFMIGLPIIIIIQCATLMLIYNV